MSKVYKNTSSFVPEQILPRLGHPSEPAWQDIVAGHSSRSAGHGSFAPDRTAGSSMTTDKKPFISAEDADGENSLSSDQATAGGGNGEEAPVPVIDLELIREKAFTEGVVEGRRQADEDFGTSVNTLRAACDQLTHLHETILRNNLNEMHTLVMEIAEKIIRHSIEEQSETILATIEDAIRLAVKSEEFQIRVNPADMEVIRQKKQAIIDEISGLDNIVLKPDSSIDRGGCLLESANCTVDATMTSQLQVIAEALHSDHTAATSSS